MILIASTGDKPSSSGHRFKGLCRGGFMKEENYWCQVVIIVNIKEWIIKTYQKPTMVCMFIVKYIIIELLAAWRFFTQQKRWTSYKWKNLALISQDLGTWLLIVNGEVVPNATVKITSNMYETTIRYFTW